LRQQLSWGAALRRPEINSGCVPQRAVAAARLAAAAKRVFDLVGAGAMLVILSPLILCVALAIVVDSRGGVFYRCSRVGQRGRAIWMLKFRKMHGGASGVALTAPDDERFTRVGRCLARTKLDEIPQLWNVLRGDMSLVGPRPEDPGFVERYRHEYGEILLARPGITGLCQLAFAKESEILDPDNRVEDYVSRVLPQKIALDRLYAQQRSLLMDLRILGWTCVAVLVRRDVAVHRSTGRLSLRRRAEGSLEFGGARVV